MPLSSMSEDRTVSTYDAFYSLDIFGGSDDRLDGPTLPPATRRHTIIGFVGGHVQPALGYTRMIVTMVVS